MFSRGRGFRGIFSVILLCKEIWEFSRRGIGPPIFPLDPRKSESSQIWQNVNEKSHFLFLKYSLDWITYVHFMEVLKGSFCQELYGLSHSQPMDKCFIILTEQLQKF